MSDHPGAHVVVVPLSQTGMELTGRAIEQKEGGGGHGGGPFREMPDTGGKRGKLAAIDVRTLLGTSVQGFPVSFSAGGKQYVAISTGTGGGSPRRAPRALTPEIRHPEHGNALYVFALPD